MQISKDKRINGGNWMEEEEEDVDGKWIILFQDFIFDFTLIHSFIHSLPRSSPAAHTNRRGGDNDDSFPTLMSLLVIADPREIIWQWHSKRKRRDLFIHSRALRKNRCRRRQRSKKSFLFFPYFFAATHTHTHTRPVIIRRRSHILNTQIRRRPEQPQNFLPPSLSLSLILGSLIPVLLITIRESTTAADFFPPAAAARAIYIFFLPPAHCIDSLR